MYASKKADVTGGKEGVMTGVMGNGKGIRQKFLIFWWLFWWLPPQQPRVNRNSSSDIYCYLSTCNLPLNEPYMYLRLTLTTFLLCIIASWFLAARTSWIPFLSLWEDSLYLWLQQPTSTIWPAWPTWDDQARIRSQLRSVHSSGPITSIIEAERDSSCLRIYTLLQRQR